MKQIITLKNIIMEDFVNYKKPSMFLITSYCDWKCCREVNMPNSICQNYDIIDQPIKQFTIKDIYNTYINNLITQAIVIGGLEPILQIEEVINLINYFRKNDCNDDIVIYTGYEEEEISTILTKLKKYDKIIIKFGRYLFDDKPRYDKILGITLASHNQYAKRVEDL